MSTNSLPLLQHSLESPSAFTPERLMEAVRAERSLANEPVPPLCVLDFDGDLSDGLAEEGRTSPVKETPDELRLWAERGVLAVEMQAASLFAFAHARAANVAIVALVSNGVDQVARQFDTGGHAFRTDVLAAIARAADAFMTPLTGRRTVEETRRQPEN
jgi:hypothetical protein